MPTLLHALLASALLLAGPALAAPMTNDDVLKLMGAGLTEALILQSIDSAEPRFDTGAEALIKLKKAGASDAVIQHMIQRSAGGGASATGTATTAAANDAAPSPRGECGLRAADGHIGIEEDKVFLEISPLPAALEARTTATGAVLKVVTAGLGEAKKREFAVIDGGRATARVPSRLPTFADLVVDRGQNPEDVLRLVRLDSKKGKRLVGLMVNEADGRHAFAPDRVVPLRFDMTIKSCRRDGKAYSVYHAIPAQPLTPGEYAIAQGGELYFGFGVD